MSHKIKEQEEIKEVKLTKEDMVFLQNFHTFNDVMKGLNKYMNRKICNKSLTPEENKEYHLLQALRYKHNEELILRDKIKIQAKKIGD